MKTGWLYGPVAAVLLALSCEEGGVGDPCVPEDEYSQAFPGFDVTEIDIESRSFQCSTRVCLVNRFAGRVSCPYGAKDGASCALPGTDGASPEERTTVEVPPQLVARRPEDAVYCSCRCAGPDPDAHYCECPSGFACTPLVPTVDVGQGQGELVGSYCVKQGTQVGDARVLEAGRRCSIETLECGPIEGRM